MELMYAIMHNLVKLDFELKIAGSSLEACNCKGSRLELISSLLFFTLTQIIISHIPFLSFGFISYNGNIVNFVSMAVPVFL